MQCSFVNIISNNYLSSFFYCSSNYYYIDTYLFFLELAFRSYAIGVSVSNTELSTSTNNVAFSDASFR